MLLLISIREGKRPRLGQSCSFALLWMSLLCMSFVNFLSVCVCASFHFGFEAGVRGVFLFIAFLFTFGLVSSSILFQKEVIVLY